MSARWIGRNFHSPFHLDTVKSWLESGLGDPGVDRFPEACGSGESDPPNEWLNSGNGSHGAVSTYPPTWTWNSCETSRKNILNQKKVGGRTHSNSDGPFLSNALIVYWSRWLKEESCAFTHHGSCWGPVATDPAKRWDIFRHGVGGRFCCKGPMGKGQPCTSSFIEVSKWRRVFFVLKPLALSNICT